MRIRVPGVRRTLLDSSAASPDPEQILAHRALHVVSVSGQPSVSTEPSIDWRTFSSTIRLKQVENPSNQKLSFLLSRVFIRPPVAQFSRLRVRKQNSANDQQSSSLLLILNAHIGR